MLRSAAGASDGQAASVREMPTTPDEPAPAESGAVFPSPSYTERMTPRTSADSLPLNFEISLRLLERGYDLKHGGTLTSPQLPGKVRDFLGLIEKEGIDWVLVGAEAVNLWHEKPRATVDVDIVVRKKHIARTRRLIEKNYGEVTEDEVRLLGTLSPAPNLLTIDVIKSQVHPLFDEALDRQVRMGPVRTPRLEALLALKFLSAVSPWRPRKDKLQDVSDFMRAFEENAKTIDRQLLVELASLAHENARQEFAAFLDAVETGKPITI